MAPYRVLAGHPEDVAPRLCLATGSSRAVVTSRISSSNWRWRSIPVPWDGTTGTASLDRLVTVLPERLRNRNLTRNADPPAEDQRTRAGCWARLSRATPEVSAPATLAVWEYESGEPG